MNGLQMLMGKKDSEPQAAVSLPNEEAMKKAVQSDLKEDAQMKDVLTQALIAFAPALIGAAAGKALNLGPGSVARGLTAGTQAGAVGLQTLEQGRREKQAREQAEKERLAMKESEAKKLAKEEAKQRQEQFLALEKLGLSKKELTLKEQELAQKAKEEKQLPASQYAAGTFSRRLEQSEAVFDQLDKAGYDRASIGQGLANILPQRLQNEALKAQSQAERNFLNAVLRKESGAAISEAEFANAEAQYFPRAGDTPEVKAQKKANRQQVLAGLQAEAGKALEKIPLVQVPSVKPEVSSFPGMAQAVAAPAAEPTDRQKRILELRKQLGK